MREQGSRRRLQLATNSSDFSDLASSAAAVSPGNNLSPGRRPAAMTTRLCRRCAVSFTIASSAATSGRAEQQSGNQLAHHRRLADVQQGFAQQAAGHHQRDNLCDEDYLGGALAGAACGERRQRQSGR